MPTILVADDDQIMIKLYELNFRKAGYTVAVCVQGDSVLAKAAEIKPDLVILDYMLPGKTGLELLKSFREDPRWKTLPVIVITAQGKTQIKADLLKAGAHCVLTKPFSPTALLREIQILLR